MKADRHEIERAKTDFFSSLASHFRELAAASDLKIDDARLTAVWEQGLFVAGVGARSGAMRKGSQGVGLIQVSTPRNLPLLTQRDREVAPGNYAILVYEDGSVHLREVGGTFSVPVAPPGSVMKDSGGGGIETCSSGLQLEFQYKDCQLCITLVCPGQWVLLLWCFKIPFCDLLTGLLEIF